MRYRSTELLRLAGLALAYALFAKVALGFFSADGVVSIVWPSSGLALAALLIGGRKYWPGVFIGALAGNLIAGSALVVSAAIAVGNTLEALAGVWLLARFGRFDADLRHPRDFFLLGLAGALSACVSASIGVATLWLTGLLATSMIARNLLLWWQGDMLGIILLTPLLLVWRKRPQGWLGRGRTVEILACFGLAFMAGQIIFLGWFHEFFGASARGFWMFLFVAWGAARFGRHGVLLILGMTAVQMLLGTVTQSAGFTNNLVPTGALNFWFYMMALTVTGVSLALVIDRRKRMESTLRESEERLRLVLDGVGPQMFVGLLDTAGVVLLANRPALEVAGLRVEDVLDKPVEETYWLSYSDAVRQRLRSAVQSAANGEVVRYDEQIRVAEGQFIWVDFCIQPLRDETGKIAYLVPSAIAIDERKRAEEALRESEARIRNIFEQAGEGIFVIAAADNRYLDVNARGLELLGYTRKELLQMTVADVLTPRERPRLAIEEVEMMAGKPHVGEWEHLRKDGTSFPAEVNARKLNDKTYLAIVRDLTRRKRTETILRESEEMLRKAQQIAKLGSWTYGVGGDSSGRITWSDEMYRIYGVSPQTFTPNAESFIKLVHPDDRAAMQAWINACSARKKPGELVFRGILPDGSVRYISGRSELILDNEGRASHLSGTAMDITERKLAELKLAASESRLHNIIDTEPECVKLVAADGSLLEMNSAGLRMIEADSFREVENLCIYPLVAEQHRQAFMELNEKVFAGGSGTLEFQVVGLKGGQRWLETHANPLRDESGHVTALLGVTRDITERKQAEARVLRLTQLYKALSQINLAIVRMGQQQELFPLVCRCAVEFGGMALAWVGQLDEASSLILPVASYGEGLDYLKTVRVSSRAEIPEGCGPTGTALRENRSVIINDYFADPMTVPWQQHAARYAWGSAASFPIQRSGKPFAVLSVYHLQINAFDEEAIALLDEMSKDITFALDNFEREAQRKAGEESLRLAASVYESSSEAIMVTDADDLIIAVNPAFTAITGYGAEEVIGKNPSLLNSGRHDEMFYQAMWREINTSGKWQGEIWDRRKNGEVYPKWLTINTVFHTDGSVLRRIALFTDITQKKESDELIWRQANFDGLTALPNRQMFHDRLDQDLKKAYRANLPLALMLLDLDGFKEINDTLGHDMGDALLKETARRLASCVRETDTVARLGGDEFTVILGELDDAGSVERVAQEILRKLAEPFRLRDDVAYVSASIGITLYPEDATDIDELIKHADQAMYAAKNKGRNRYHYFTSAMQEAAQNRMRITNDLRGALAGKQFWVAYQPIVELATGVIRKAEALVRWQHPTRGLVSPTEFISIAEDAGLIIDLGDWVFREAAQQVKLWRKSLHPDFQISVNKSPVQFHNVSQSHMVWYDYLKELGLPGQSITVEITEGLLLDANPVVTSRLLEFRDAGMQVSLDDFGTGYSSLSYLKKFDIDYLKIDQSFVRHLAPGSDDMALCSAIIEMAHKLGLLVIAEGVETEQQKALLEQVGCDFAQGYLYSRPVPAQEFEKHYSSRFKSV